MRNRVLGIVQTTAVLLLSLVLFTCTDEVNPYDVPTAAEIVWGDRTPAEGSSIPIFTGTKIEGKVLLPKHVERLRVITADNMAENADTLVFDAGSRIWPAFTFRVSFPDTGWKMITATGILSNKDSITADRRIYVHSPLNPSDIDAGIGTRVELKTDPVGDDVTYVWDLYISGAVQSKKSGTNVVKYTLPWPAPDSGVLYVESTTSARRSIGTSFLVTARDLAPPQITLVDAILSASRDTVHLNRNRTGVTFQVIDGEQGVKEVTVNGVEIPCSSHVCTYTPTFSETGIEKQSISIAAKDFAGNLVRENFVVRYDPSEGVDPEIKLYTKLDEQSRIITTNKTVPIDGYVASALGRTFGLKILRNSALDTVITVSDGTFDVDRTIVGETVEFSLELYPDTTVRGNYLSQKTFTAVYSAIDETAPEFRGFYIGDARIADGHITAESVVTLRVLVKDPNSSIISVDIESDSTTNEGDGYYSTQVTLSHDSSGNDIGVVARNEYDLTARDYITIKYNRLPEASVKTAKSAFVNTMVTDTFSYSDPDGDELVALTIYRGFPGSDTSVKVSPNEKGLLEWTPDTVDDYYYIGTVSDGYETVEFQSSKNHISQVRDTSEPVEPTRFVITKELDDTLTAALDSLSFLISTNPPFESSKNGLLAELKTDQGEFLENLTVVGDSLLLWTPLSTDTGKYLVRLNVTTFGEVTDSLSRPLVVVPKPKVTFAEASGDIAESESTYSFDLRMSRPVTDAVPVAVKVKSGGSATRGSDYTFTDTADTFSPGDTHLSLSVSIINDQTQDKDENVFFELVGLSALVEYSNQSHTLYITDDDTGSTAIEQPKVSFVTAAQRVREQDTTLRVEISLSKAPHEPLEVGVGTGGTAALSEDYVFSPERVRFEIGETLAEIQVTILVDSVCERTSENIQLLLENPSGAEFGDLVAHDIEIDPNEQDLCSKNALVITGNCGRYKTECDKIDSRVIDTLSAHGYVVTRVMEGEFTGSADPILAGKGVVFLSQSIRPQSKVAERLRDAAKPVVCASANSHYSTLGLATATGTSEKEFLVVHPNTALRKELTTTQEVRILSGFQSVPWAVPTKPATVVATLRGESDHAAIFLYDAGATLADGTKAASARAGFPMIDISGAPPEYEAEWWKLLIEVLDWAANKNE